MTVLDTLRAMSACPAAIEWAEAQADQTPGALWATCPRGDWMLWVLERERPDRTDLAPIAYACAERARQHAIAALGLELGAKLAACAPIANRETALAAFSAADAAARSAAWSAASAAAFAAFAAASASAATAAWAAASAAAWAAADAAWAAAESTAEHKACADHVRALFPPPPVIGGGL